MQIVIPMSGLGERFRLVGYALVLYFPGQDTIFLSKYDLAYLCNWEVEKYRLEK